MRIEKKNYTDKYYILEIENIYFFFSFCMLDVQCAIILKTDRTKEKKRKKNER